MIKAVLFDLDGVLTIGGDDVATTCDYLASRLGMDTNKLQKAYRNGIDLWKHYGGEIGVDAVWKNFYSNARKEGLGFSCEEFEAMRKDAFGATEMDRRMIGLARTLRDHKIPVGIITDNGAERADVLLDMHDLYRIFNPIIVSEKIRMTKHHTDIFLYAVEQMNSASGYKLFPSEFLFIDNNPANCQVAMKAGMYTILFDHLKRDHDSLEQKLRDLGINV